MFNKIQKFWEELWWGPAYANKNDACKSVDAIKAEKIALNFGKILSNDSDVSNVISIVSKLRVPARANAEASAIRFGCDYTSEFIFEDPRSRFYDKLLHWSFNKTL